ncbi:nitronate monooxygenase [Miniphocaeibacter halophilus]|uniref:Nitronate monooxygenase n=1 Tax=Miniphocaeibacter halophilus TaxID=2931922 RepID=A0AC61MU54_9FIRM|nr:nitronate monooxygenase [Miniphocaeibacter halophilus]QQK08145.1 nitronate monooxygenase [Miniphocaeibacter halophilus]
MNLQDILGIEYPIIQGGMANIATGEFAAAVSNAGGLGLIGTGGMTVEEAKENIEKCKKLTNKPFGVNIMLLNPNADEVAKLIVEYEVPVVTTGAGNPSKYIDEWKKHGIKIFPVIPAPSLAVRMERLGVDGVIAEGTESGGHIGEMTTMALIPQVCDVVKIPVIAAGGIASGRQMLAARALGAIGVQVGTCLLAAEECPIHENYKNRVIKAKSSNITVTGRIGGIPVRLIKNSMTNEYIKREKEGWTKEQLEIFTLGGLKKAVFDGDIDNGSLMAGQVVGQVKEIKAVKDIIKNLYDEYLEELEKLKCQ